MGLEISSYSGIAFSSDESYEKELGSDSTKTFTVAINPDYKNHSYELVDGASYSFLKRGFFNAGNLNGFNKWKIELARAIGYEIIIVPSNGLNTLDKHRVCNKIVYSRGPFEEFIWFSDVSGIFGPEVCRKLSDDFNSQIIDKREVSGNFFEMYDKWLKAFNHAGAYGAVVLNNRGVSPY